MTMFFIWLWGFSCLILIFVSFFLVFYNGIHFIHWKVNKNAKAICLANMLLEEHKLLHGDKSMKYNLNEGDVCVIYNNEDEPIDNNRVVSSVEEKE